MTPIERAQRILEARGKAPGIFIPYIRTLKSFKSTREFFACGPIHCSAEKISAGAELKARAQSEADLFTLAANESHFLASSLILALEALEGIKKIGNSEWADRIFVAQKIASDALSKIAEVSK